MSSTFIPSASFDNAAAYLSSAPSLSKVSNATKLEIYGLFKYLTVSIAPNTSRPGLLDFAGRAKWDAWKATGEKYNDRALDVEKRYLQVATELGWIEGESSRRPKPSGSKVMEEDGDIWDKEDTPRSDGGVGGLGNSVSTFSHDNEERREEGSFHNYAVSGNKEGLNAYLEAQPETQLDEKDEYGYTALHLASDRGHAAVVKLLLERGADPSIKDPDDFTALELAQVAEHDEVVQILESKL